MVVTAQGLRCVRVGVWCVKSQPSVYPWRTLALENPKSGPDLTRKLGKDGKLTLQECQHRMDNSICLFCRKTGHVTKECPKPMAVTAQAHPTVMELQESFIEEAKEN